MVPACSLATGSKAAESTRGVGRNRQTSKRKCSWKNTKDYCNGGSNNCPKTEMRSIRRRGRGPGIFPKNKSMYWPGLQRTTLKTNQSGPPGGPAVFAKQFKKRQWAIGEWPRRFRRIIQQRENMTGEQIKIQAVGPPLSREQWPGGFSPKGGGYGLRVF